MPIFDYHCRDCDRRENDVQWIMKDGDAPSERACPCGGSLVRLIGLPQVWPPSGGWPDVPGPEFLAGTGLEDMDGENPYAEPGEPSYIEPKIRIDMGAR